MRTDSGVGRIIGAVGRVTPAPNAPPRSGIPRDSVVGRIVGALARADNVRDGVPIGPYAHLPSAILVDMDLRQAVLVRANLVGANLRRAILIAANLTNADLHRAILIAANLTNADLINADCGVNPIEV